MSQIAQNHQGDGEERAVSIPLGIGIFFIPFVFSWFTLRKGHTTKAKVISFLWLAFTVILGVTGEPPKEVPDTPAPKEVTSEMQVEQAPVALEQTKEKNSPAENEKAENHQPVLKGGYGACVSEDLFNQFTQAAVKKDKQGFQYLLNHGCVITKAGIPVSVLDTTWTGTAKVRAYADGQAAVLWTNVENIDQ